jgi:hypothetical protein
MGCLCWLGSAALAKPEMVLKLATYCMTPPGGK